MTRILKRIIKRSLTGLGYEIRRMPVAAPSPPRRPQDDWPWPWLRTTWTIRTIVDIGANNGEFAQFLANFFAPAATYAFEPLPSCVPELRAKAESIANFHIFNVALSDRPGVATFYENSYPPSSSFLRVGRIHKREFPQTSSETAISVPLARLDDLVDGRHLDREILVKVDVQGVEDQVIRGGREVFAAARCVVVEMSFVEMYERQPLFEEVHALLADLGLRLAGVKDQVFASSSGRPLFAHCVYVRSAPAS
jgi:FkbM family methyltransferase